MSTMRIGILAVQGNFREHAAMLRRLGADPVEVRKPEQLDDLDGLVVPGGESTTFMRLMRLYGLEEAIRRFEQPILGTCAGLIVLDGDHLGLVDVEVARNGYGRQVFSFEADLKLSGDDRPLRGVFIRAPRVTAAGRRRRGARRARRRAGPPQAGPLPGRYLPPRAHGRHARARALSRVSQGGEPCPDIASGRRSSGRKARPTRSAASSSRS